MALGRARAEPTGDHGKGLAIGGLVCAVVSLGYSGVLVFVGHEPALYQQLLRL